MSKRERADDIESIVDIFDVTATIDVFVLPLFDSVDSCMPEISQAVKAFLRPNILPIPLDAENYNTCNLSSKDPSAGKAECHMELSSPYFAELG